MPHLSREEEADRLLAAYGIDAFPAIMTMLERQFVVLHNRAQVALTLCGIIISTTGFSGRNIAGTGLAARVLIIAGIGLILVAAGTVVWGVLHLRWLSMQAGADTRAWLLTSLLYRDRKTKSYRVGVLLLLCGLTLYVGAIALMLLDPHRKNWYAAQ